MPASLLNGACGALELAGGEEDAPRTNASGGAPSPVGGARTSAYSDGKIRNICLLLSVAVAFNHSRTISLFYGWEGVSLEPVSADYLQRPPFEILLQHFLSGALGRITNPFFFLISGFLFFYGWQPTLAGWWGKMRKRMFTLLVPFLVWGFIGKLVNLGDWLFTRPDSLAEQSDALIQGLPGVWELLISMPSSGQLWFVRALLLIMLAAPVLALLIAKLRASLLLVIFAVYVSPWQTPWDSVDKSAICFFSFAATLGFLRANIEWKSRVLVQWASAAWLSLAAIYTALSLVTVWDLTLLFKFLILAGVPGIWALYELVPNAIHDWLGRLSPYRFFVYMGFEPLLTIVQDKYYASLAPSQATHLLGYLCFPTLVVALCLAVACLLRRGAPNVYSFLSGGR